MACCLQVEQNLHPSLKDRAFAIQQHQDIIAVSTAFQSHITRTLQLVASRRLPHIFRAASATLQVNYAARAAGVKKHMAPKEVRLSQVTACCLLLGTFATQLSQGA